MNKIIDTILNGNPDKALCYLLGFIFIGGYCIAFVLELVFKIYKKHFDE